jgi:hypothetical protein
MLLTAVTMGITLLFSVLVISVHTRKVGQQLSEIGVLRRSVQDMQRDFAEIVRIADRTSIGLQELSGFGLHFRQMKREQVRLSEKLDMISRVTDSLAGVLQLRDEVPTEHQEELLRRGPHRRWSQHRFTGVENPHHL